MNFCTMVFTYRTNAYKRRIWITRNSWSLINPQISTLPIFLFLHLLYFSLLWRTETSNCFSSPHLRFLLYLVLFCKDDYFLFHKETKRCCPCAFSSLIPHLSLDLPTLLMPGNCFVGISTWMLHRCLQHVQDQSHKQTPLPLLIPVLVFPISDKTTASFQLPKSKTWGSSWLLLLP